MPVTRRQATKIARRIVIPTRNDTSLIQKRGNCIEGLATALFQIIQDYLSEYDYCQLMNTNLSTFQPIKYETVHYTISANKSDLCETYNEMVALQMIVSVKDKFKQITVKLSNVEEKLIRKYAQFYDGVETLHLMGFAFSFNSKTFGMLHSICRLILMCGNLSSVVDFNLENLSLLIIWNCINVTEISSWNSSNKLRSVTIKGCPDVQFIPPLDNIKIVKIDSCYSLTKFQTTGGHARFCWVEFEGHPLSKEAFQCMVQPAFYAKMQHLKLSCYFPSQFLGFSLWKNITVVILTAPPGDRHSFPVFYGVDLRLENFSLSAWNDCKELPNVKFCILTGCEDFRVFPVSPMLTGLRVENCSDLRTIPSLPTLQVLGVFSCPLLEKIDYCPDLMTAKVYDCVSMRVFSLCLPLELLSISECEILKTLQIPPVINMNGEASNIRNSSLQTKCRLRLGEDLPSMTDFTFCQNIYQVELLATETLVNLQGFNNISCLKIVSCFHLVTTEGIGKVFYRIILQDCPDLIRLVGLQGIPEVFIEDCDNIVDFTGLGNQELLGVTRSKEFSKLLREHTQNHLLHAHIFSTTKEIRVI
jgi:hypothetical protein